jgi:hypothetical protein
VAKLDTSKIPTKKKYNYTKKTGRPLKYTDEYLEKLAKEMIAWFKKKKNWWLKDFSIEKGFCWSRFCEFAEVNKEFSLALELCKQIQESKLVHKSFLPYQDRPAYNALKNVCGWRDQQNIVFDDTQFEITIGGKKKI